MAMLPLVLPAEPKPDFGRLFLAWDRISVADLDHRDKKIAKIETLKGQPMTGEEIKRLYGATLFAEEGSRQAHWRAKVVILSKVEFKGASSSLNTKRIWFDTAGWGQVPGIGKVRLEKLLDFAAKIQAKEEKGQEKE